MKPSFIQLKGKLQSRIATGTIRHRRFTPFLREFEHSVTYFLIALSEVPTIFNKPFLFSDRFPALFRFNRKCYFEGDFEGEKNVSLDAALRDRVEKELSFRPNGEILLLTQISSFGIGFNPVSFYFFMSKATGKPEVILSEITNTPWDERHAYVHDCRTQDREAKKFSFPKIFHVSPFLGMSYRYEWSFLVKNDGKDEKIFVHMNNVSIDTENRKDFDATFQLNLLPITGRNLLRTLATSPLMVLRTIFLIYLHAFILWKKKTPFFSHPKLSSSVNPKQGVQS